MKKIIMLLMLSSFCRAVAFSQPCLSGGITFSTQADIDNFQINYPNCTEIQGNVSISGNGIANLSGLSVLRQILGNLSIYSNDSLINLSGLNGLTRIGGDLTLSVNPHLANLSGLNGLKSIAGSMVLNYTSLTDLSGLDSLAHVGGDLQFTINPELSSLTGLEKLSAIAGSIFIYGNSGLQSVAGLLSLKSINGPLVIQQNSLLSGLSGFDSVNPGTITNLAILNNSNLSTCAIASICDYLSSPNGTVSISNNGAGCNSQTEIEDACELLSLAENDQPARSMSVFPNPCKDFLTVYLSKEMVNHEAIRVYNHLGQLVSNRQLKNNTLDVSGLNAGMYFLILTSENKTYTSTFIIDK
jgi:hypothetical protein